MKVYVDVLKYNAVVIEHDTEVHAGDNERHPDHQAPTSGDGTAVTLRHVWAPKATQMQRRHAPTHALTHMRSLTHTKRNLSNFSSGMRETTIESGGRLRQHGQVESDRGGQWGAVTRWTSRPETTAALSVSVNIDVVSISASGCVGCTPLHLHGYVLRLRDLTLSDMATLWHHDIVMYGPAVRLSNFTTGNYHRFPLSGDV